MSTSALKLHVFDKPASSPYLSYYCQKLETFLRATSIPYEHAPALPFNAPRSQLPYVTLPSGEVITDSQIIIQHLSADPSRDYDLDKHLTPAQRAQSRAYIAYIDELVFKALVWHRASEPENWEQLYKEVFVAQLPWGLRDLAAAYQKRQYSLAAWYNGLGRRPKDEVRGILAEWVDGIQAIIRSHEVGGESGNMLGLPGPTSADVAVYSLLVCALGTASNRFVTEKILGSRTLRMYVKRFTELWFPEYAQVLSSTANAGDSVSLS